jgi:hypothetical protein
LRELGILKGKIDINISLGPHPKMVKYSTNTYRAKASSNISPCPLMINPQKHKHGKGRRGWKGKNGGNNH